VTQTGNRFSPNGSAVSRVRTRSKEWRQPGISVRSFPPVPPRKQEFKIVSHAYVG
jgi:hypothetical protein